MPKRRKPKRVSDLIDAVSDEEKEADPDPNSNEFLYDEVDDFHHKREKILLDSGDRKWVGMGSESEDEENEEVLGLDMLSEEEGNKDAEYELESDFDDEREAEDFLPDRRAWGKRKGTFYSRDYEADEQKRLEGEEQEAAELEEKEAREIQKRLVAELDEVDFGFDMILPMKKDSQQAQEEETKAERVQADFSGLSKKEKLELLKKESPEFLELIHDCKEKMKELHQLSAVLKLASEGRMPQSGCEYVRTKYSLITNYCTNVAYYILLKSKCVPVQSHPVLRRLVQFRQLLKELESVDEQVTSQVESLLERMAVGEEIPVVSEAVKTKNRKTLQILTKMGGEPEAKRVRFEAEASGQGRTKQKLGGTSKMAIMGNVAAKSTTPAAGSKKAADSKPLPIAKFAKETPNSNLSAGTSMDATADSADADDASGMDKRGITKEMAKNRGQTPKPRKKDRRNPRMKHRTQFKKAVIRRRGQVRDVRKEVQLYSGEKTGIKAGLVKSIKIKA